MAPSQILLVSIVVIGVIVGAVVITNWARSQYYVALYTNLSGEEGGKIVERLNEMSVSYEITHGGTTINVPSSDLYETRMKLATLGLPNADNIGYALFDRSNIGMTDFLQKVNYKRAIEGELARTISGLNEISAARVHLVMPEERLFKEDQNSPSASIMLKLSGTSQLTKSQLKGITYLVASSVEGMSPEKVTVVDDSGNLLTSQSTNDETAMFSSNQFELRMNVEKYLERKAQSLLASVVGAGRSTVRVTVELDFQQQNTQIETYDPDKTVLRSEQRTTQKGSEQQAVPGQSQTTTTNDNLEDVITNYEVSRTVQNIIGEVGKIKRMTVAVLVDGTYKTETSPEGEGIQEYSPRTPEELNNLSAIVKNSIGYDQARGDFFEIVNLPFENSFMGTSRGELENADKWNTYMYYGKKVGTVLLLLFAFMYLKKKLKKVFSMIAKYVPPLPPPPPPISPVEPEIPAQPQKPKLVDTMKTQAEGKPEEIAKVIKTMMSSE